MTTKVKEKYVLSQEEINKRKAISFLKGCIVGYAINQGVKYSSSKESQEDFTKGLQFANPRKVTKSYGGMEWGYTRHASSGWVTICHIIHNRLRHNKPHNSTYEIDQIFLTFKNEERMGNNLHVKEFQEALSEYGICIPGLPSEVA